MWRRKASSLCSHRSKCILAVSICSYFPISVRVCGTQWAQTFHMFSFFLKMVWTVDAAKPSSLEISTHVQHMSSSNKTFTAWTWKLSVAAMGLPVRALCWHSSLPWRKASTYLAIVLQGRTSILQASCNALKHWLAFFPLATWIFMKQLCSYLLKIFLGQYYLLNVRNSVCIHKIYYFKSLNITDLYNKDCSTMYYKITIVTTRISDL